MAAYHFRGRAGSEIEFFQMQEEAFQLSDQQQEDDAVCKLWCCMSVLAIPTARYEHLVPSWTLCRVGPNYRKSITGGGSLAPSYWILTMMYTAVLYRILLSRSYSAPACGVKQRDQARTCEQNEPFLSSSQAFFHSDIKGTNTLKKGTRAPVRQRLTLQSSMLCELKEVAPPL